MKKKHWFQKKLKKYTKKQHKTLNVASDLFSELMLRTKFLSTEQYELNRNYLLDMKKKFKRNEILSSLINELLLLIDLDFQAYMCNLEKMYPEGVFYINYAEAKYIGGLQCKQ
jgi:hypothetical protein